MRVAALLLLGVACAHARSFKQQQLAAVTDGRLNRVSVESEAAVEAGEVSWTVLDFIPDFPSDYNRMCRCKVCGGKLDKCGAIPVKVQIYLEHLHKIDDVERQADVSVIVVSQWLDDRLEGVKYHGRIEQGEIGYPVWTPDLEIRNQREPATELQSEMRFNPKGTPPGTVRQTVRLEASLVDKFDEWAFPFDSHVMNVSVASFSYSAEEVILKSAKLMDKVLTNSKYEYPQNQEWEITRTWTVDVLEASSFAAKDSLVKLRVDVARYYNSPIMNLITPVIAIVLFSTSAFFIKPTALSDRINVAAIGFLTIMAYTYVVAEQLPRVSYMLWIHWFIIVSYATVLWVTVLVIWHHVEDTRNRSAVDKKDPTHPKSLMLCNKYAGYITPVVYLALVAGLIVVNEYRR